MALILILGAGVMGSAIAVPAADNGHQVILAGTHLDRDIVAALKTDRAAHPRLGAPLPAAVEPLDIEDLNGGHFENADLIILGVSSAGMNWASERLRQLMHVPTPIALVTKGLVRDGTSPPRTFVETLPKTLQGFGLPAMPVIGIGGPCIAQELAERQPTTVVYASRDTAACQMVAQWMQTPYYRVTTSTDHVGIEACAALKNFFAIGVSAVRARHPRSDRPANSYAMNPAAAIFSQAVMEMAQLAAWIGGRQETALGLAGVGDLHVTVGAGRNGKLGLCLGQGMRVAEALSGPLKGETVEGVDTGHNIAGAFQAAVGKDILAEATFPLATSLIGAITHGAPFIFDFESLGNS